MNTQVFTTILLTSILQGCGPEASAIVEGGGGSGSGGDGFSTSGDTFTSIMTVTSVSGSDGESNSDGGTDVPNDLPSPAVCGNGIQEHGEECDRGILNNNFSACTEICKRATCMDDYIQKYGDLDDNGDGVTDWPAYNELCDDGNDIDTDACRNNCTTCGNGIWQPGEECDEPENPGCSSGCSYTPRFMFVSSEAVGMDDIAGDPDALCQSWAEKGAAMDFNFEIVGSTFKALVARSGGMWSYMNGIKDSMYLNRGGYFLFKMPRVCEELSCSPQDFDPKKEALPVYALEQPVLFDENGDEVGQNQDGVLVWTGVDGNGIAASACNNWSSAQADLKSNVGLSSSKDNKWYTNGTLGCANKAHLYCVQVYE